MVSASVKAAFVLSAGLSVLVLAWYASRGTPGTNGREKLAVDADVNGARSTTPKRKKSKKKKADKKSAAEPAVDSIDAVTADANGAVSGMGTSCGVSEEPELSAEVKEQLKSRLLQLEGLSVAQVAEPTTKKAPTSTAPVTEEQETTAADVFVHAIISRAALTQPMDLLAAASSNKKQGKKRKQLTTWEEKFMAGLHALDSQEAGAVARAQALLDEAMVSSEKPGAPKEAAMITLRGLGYLHASVGNIKEAQAAYRRALKETEKRGEANRLFGCYRDLAVLAREQREHKMAILLWQKAIAKIEGNTDLEMQKQCMEMKLALADCHWENGDSDTCVALVQECLQWRQQTLGESDPLTFAAYYDMSRVHRLLGQTDHASNMDEKWRRGLYGLCQDAGEVQPDKKKVGEYLTMLASMSQLHKHYDEALLQFEHAAPFLRDAHGLDSVEYAEFLNSKGETLGEVKRVDEAKQAFDEAVTILKQQGKPALEPSMGSVIANKAKVLSECGELQLATGLFDQAVETIERSGLLQPEAFGSQEQEQHDYIMCQVLLARVLKLYANHERLQGKEESADEMEEMMRSLETKYGFTVQ